MRNIAGPLIIAADADVAGRALFDHAPQHIWQKRFYDFNVWTEHKRIEKLRYIHRNPVRRGLVSSPEQWPWSSFRHYVSGIEGVVEIESQWTARKREQLGVTPRVVRQDQNPRPVSAKGAETRTGQPQRG